MTSAANVASEFNENNAIKTCKFLQLFERILLFFSEKPGLLECEDGVVLLRKNKQFFQQRTGFKEHHYKCKITKNEKILN